jgi:phenylalanyl-tRNA synthetase beta chain
MHFYLFLKFLIIKVSMKISYNWLKKYLALDELPEKIAQILTDGGLEVEKVEQFESVRGGLNGFVIGEVLTCEKHPGADKLKKTTVNIGNGIVLPIVCGAPNVDAGQKVIVATVGTTIYPKEAAPFKINKAKIRGEVSEGMICAADEMGIGHSHEGILVLETALPPGTPAKEYFHVTSDFIFEIGLTPNRADAASHLGVARDLRALLKREFIIQNTDEEFKIRNSQYILSADKINQIQVQIEDKVACPRYASVTIQNVKVGLSPAWLQDALRSIGVSPINNLVDITNYILHDLGQPLHAFDADKIKGHKIIVKHIPDNTRFITLDGVERKLNNHDLMICDEEKPLCIAGVFGGKDSGVSTQTQNVFLESAYFTPTGIRKTALHHGLKTDASFRFERGTDPDMPVKALKKAMLLIMEIAGGTCSEINDIYDKPIEAAEIEVDIHKINLLIGRSFSTEQIKDILIRLDFEVNDPEGSGKKLHVKVPPYKVDISRQADIAEEVLRIYGYNNIELSDRIGSAYIAEFPVKSKDKIQKTISGLLIPHGFYETMTNSLTRSSFSSLINADNEKVTILNALSESLDSMRQTLLFSGLEVVSHNINRQNKNLKLFEFGKIYKKTPSGYTEYNRLAIFLTGDLHEESWSELSTPVSFHHLQTFIYSILFKLGLREGLQSDAVDNEIFAGGRVQSLKGKVVVTYGPVTTNLLKVTDVRQPVWYADFDFDLLVTLIQENINFRELSKFPEVRRDLSLVLDKKVTFSEIRALTFRTEKKLIREVNVFDVYEGDKIANGKKSYSVSFIMQDSEQTLTDKVIDNVMNKLIQTFEKDLGAIIRK